jgi:hypothetical protein
MADPEILDREATQQQTALVDTGSRMSEILAAQARAQVQAHYLVAQSNKRDMDTVRTVLLKECDRPRFAAAALKRKPGIAEPMLTIRFAEAVQRAMGNLEPTRMIVFESPTQRIVRLGLSDLETNNHPTRDLVIEKVVERKNKQGRNVISQRLNSQGEVVYLVEATEDEMFTKESAWGSKWERQLTFKHLPADIQDECYYRCLQTQQKADKADPDAAKKAVIDGFFALGINAEQLKEYLGIDSLDILTKPLKEGEINPYLSELRQIYAAIKEGDTNWREVMEARNEARGTKTGEQQQSTAAGKAKAAAAAKAGKATPKQDPAPPAAAQAPQPDARTEEMGKLFTLLTWSVDQQARWCKANANLGIDEQIAKLKKLFEEDPPASDGAKSEPATQSKQEPTAIDADGWT